MRLLDLAVAGIIGGASLYVILGLNPQPYLSSASSSATEASLQDWLSAFISSHGLFWLQNASPAELCSEAAVDSNSSFNLRVSFGSTDCGPPPVQGSTVVTYDLSLPQRRLVLQAWSKGQD